MAWARRALPILLVLGVAVVCLGPGLMIMRPAPCGPLPSTHRCCLVAHLAPAMVAPATIPPPAAVAVPAAAATPAPAAEVVTLWSAVAASPPSPLRSFTALRV